MSSILDGYEAADAMVLLMIAYELSRRVQKLPTDRLPSLVDRCTVFTCPGPSPIALPNGGLSGQVLDHSVYGQWHVDRMYLKWGISRNFDATA